MDNLLEIFATALTAFVGSNIDDIFLLTLFFSQRNAGFRATHIVIGQYLGFSLILAVSSVGMLSGLIFPTEWIGLLGLAPIYIGLRKLISKGEKSDNVELPTNAPTKFGSLLNPATYSVAAVTVANGGDNISIYVPLFASTPIKFVFVIFAIFLVMLAIWQFVGFKLASHPTVAQGLHRHGHWFVPLFLVGLGIYILIENKTFSVLRKISSVLGKIKTIGLLRLMPA